MALPRELEAAVANARDRHSEEVDSARRAQLLAKTHRTLDAWLRRNVTTADAIATLAR